MVDLLILIALVVGLVLLTAAAKMHPFLALLITALVGGVAFGLPLLTEGDSLGVVSVVTAGFGTTLGNIGIVIVLGTVIGVFLDRSGAAITMADAIIKIFGKRFPTLTMSAIGYVVSIPVFCDSAYVILNSLKESMAARTKTSPVAMSVALATGLYATHTLVPPTPGPIAAAGNLGLSDKLGLVMAVGLAVGIVSAAAGSLWALRFSHAQPEGESNEHLDRRMAEFAEVAASTHRPGTWASFAPILVPIVLIMLGSAMALPFLPATDSVVADALRFVGQPVIALLVGVALAIYSLHSRNGEKTVSDRIGEGIVDAAPILLITGAGGAFGAVIAATDLGSYLGDKLSALGIGILVPFLIAAALKTAQGSSTVSMVTTSALVAPLLGDLGLTGDLGATLAVMAVGLGAMTVSHANDSYFWVVSQFSRMSVGQAYRAQTTGTLIQGLAGMLVVLPLSLLV
ncbi:GntP family permease [Nocardioides insulae]|uniref:GntP family permease n=1 Tax=Nocardioides insulae TaxID=394734 RepID=UPI000405120C|nr:GntP family permease [Nocardioides insulae]